MAEIVLVNTWHRKSPGSKILQYVQYVIFSLILTWTGTIERFNKENKSKCGESLWLHDLVSTLLNSWNIFSTLSLSWCNSRGPDIRPCGNPQLSNMALNHCPSTFNLLVPTWLVRTRPAEKGRRLFGLKEKRVCFFFHIHGNLTFANDWGRTLRYWSGG